MWVGVLLSLLLFTGATPRAALPHVPLPHAPLPHALSKNKHIAYVYISMGDVGVFICTSTTHVHAYF